VTGIALNKNDLMTDEYCCYYDDDDGDNYDWNLNCVDSDWYC
jgi:hypothetical protein